MKKKRPHVPKFRRAAPEVRREALIDATLRCLKKHGHDGVSVRRISAEAGVSIDDALSVFTSATQGVTQARRAASRAACASQRTSGAEEI